MNRAPELELLEALENDGYDVKGAKIRIHAMYGIVKQHMEMQKDISEMRRYLSAMKDIVEYQTTERGMNVSFTGKDKGGAWGGYVQRRLPIPNELQNAVWALSGGSASLRSTIQAPAT